MLHFFLNIGVQNLDKLVMILKNRPSDVKTRCVLASKGMKGFFVVKGMFDDYKDKLEEAGYFGDDSQNL